MSLDDQLDDQSYEIKDELKVRKVLERHTNWQLEFTKNDKFDYDLRITQWDSEPSGPADSDTAGFLEIERSRADNEHSWITGSVPDGWYYYSFLMRKVRDWDNRTGSWGPLKDDYERTLYMKFNHAMDNCFVTPVATIHSDGSRTKASDGRRTNTYLKLPLDHPQVIVGIDDAIEFVEEYLQNYEGGQQAITEWGAGR